MTRLARHALALVSGSCLLVPAARAQPLKPNVLVIFDTSGSMADTNATTGFGAPRIDGSPLCDGQGQDRRIFILKQAMAAALAEIGTDEANFGLMRFPMKDRPGITPVCPRGHYEANDAETGIRSGNPSQPVSPGCRISTQNRDMPETTFGPWFRNGMRDAIVLDVTRPFDPATGPTAGHFDPPDGNIYGFYRWIDNIEESNGMVITQPEIRAGPEGAGYSGLPTGTSGGWATPLGRSLLYARLYFENFIVPNDPRRACRENLVILVTDGVESCDPLPSGPGTPAINPMTCANTGTLAYPELHPVVQACRLLRGTAGVKTYVLTDSTLVAGNNPVAAAGGTGTAIGVSLVDTNAIKQRLVQIIAENVPPVEVCNGLDDDCDGLTDEDPIPGAGAECDCGGLVTRQQDGRGDCRLGVTVCRGAQGLRCEGCVGPSPERCNNKDDNCNGVVDEGFNKGAVCDNGQMGVCRRAATTLCTPDGSGVYCPVMPAVPSPEICNGLDDDCDGQTDEGVLPGVGDPCGVDIGECRAGVFECTGGRLVCSQMMSMGTPEICDARDNNCNGQTDEGLGGEVCACAPHSLQTLMTGECRPGTLVCKGREPLDCEGCIPPRPELCDDKDNDCDGMTDEGDDLCVPGRVCLSGKCELLCQDSEFPCPIGYECDEASRPRICRSTKCLGVVCDPGTYCDVGDGQCKDPCAGVVCPPPGQCIGGACQDCRSLPSLCAAGQLCRAGVCTDNPCSGVTCGADQLCVDGRCIADCAGRCPAGQRCVSGACQPDACASVRCPSNDDVCDPTTGTCARNRCLLRSCPAGQRCVPVTGECVDDPCAATRCPSPCNAAGCPAGCQRCVMTDDGAPLCAPTNLCEQRTQTTTIRTSGGGGCACAVGGAGAAGSSRPAAGWLLMLASLAAAARRGRARRKPRP